MKFEDVIREKVEGFEPSIEVQGWENLEKDLDKELPNSNNTVRNLLIGGAAAVIIAAGAYFTSNNDNINTAINENTELIQNTEVITVEEAIISNNEEVIIADDAQSSETLEKTYKPNNSLNDQPVTPTDDGSIAPSTPNREEENLDVDEADVNKTLALNAEFGISSNTGCTPFKVRLTPVLLSNDVEYEWYLGNGKTSNEMSPTITYAKPGDYNVSLTVVKDGVKKVYDYPQAIVVRKGSKVDFKYRSDGEQYTFSAISKLKNTYTWNFGDASTDKGEVVKHAYTRNNTYTVTLTTKNIKGCVSNIKQEVVYKAVHKIIMPNAFVVNSFGDNSFFGPNDDYYNVYDITMIIIDQLTQEVVFKSTEDNPKWDGSIGDSGDYAESGAMYGWRIVSIDKYGNKCDKGGKLTVIE